MPSIYGSENPGPGALPTFQADTQQTPRVRAFGGPYIVPGGQAASAEERVFGQINQSLTGWMDRAAQDEGVRQGNVAGLDPNYRPDSDPSIMGMARRNAADKTYGNMVEASARDRIAKSWNEFQALPAAQQTPAALQQRFGAIKQDFDDNHVFPEIKGQFDNAFGNMTDGYLKGAQRLADARAQDQALASFNANQNR